MEESKYGRYVITKPMAHEPWDLYEFRGDEDYESAVSFLVAKIAEPCVMEETTHSHDFDMYLHFLSFDPDDMDRLDADIELCMGSEQETQKIASPCSVFIPAGMLHNPLRFKRIGKPVLFFHTLIAPKYSKNEPGEMAS